MPIIEQSPIKPDFADNPQIRCPCVLLLDKSKSMDGPPIEQLSRGLVILKDKLAVDDLASQRVEVGIVTFGGTTEIASEFTSVEGFHPPKLSADGDTTPMGAAVLTGIRMVKDRKEMYKLWGIPYYRPWIMMITDGEPNDGDAWKEAAKQVRQGEASNEFCFFAVGVGGANFDLLKQLSVRDPLALDGLRFQELFLWLSTSLSAVSRSSPTSAAPLTDPTSGPNGWASTASI